MELEKYHLLQIKYKPDWFKIKKVILSEPLIHFYIFLISNYFVRKIFEMDV